MLIEAPKQLVTTRRDFDRKLGLLEPRIAGASAFSLYHAEKGLTQGGYSVPIFSSKEGGSVYCALHPEVYRAVFDEKPFGQAEFEPWIGMNREYGFVGAAIEYIMQQEYAPTDYSDTNIIDLSLGFRNAVEKYRKVPRFALEVVRRYLPGPLGAIWDKYDPHHFFLHPDVFLKAIVALKNRKGVQAIYGERSDFIDFLQANNPEPCDDCAAVIHVPVPSELVIAVVGLGKYEERHLLRKNQ